MGRPRRVPVWLPWEQAVVYFVTLCVNNRKPVLANPQTLAALRTASTKLKHWRLLAAVLMPDHLHVLVTPSKDRAAKLNDFSAALKRWIRQQLNAQWRWQSGCFDRLLRSDESAQNKWFYIRENPVRAGLVSKWEDWPYQIGFDDNWGSAGGAPALQQQNAIVSRGQ
jgi:REP element-mobilizing transposase RayT